MASLGRPCERPPEEGHLLLAHLWVLQCGRLNELIYMRVCLSYVDLQGVPKALGPWLKSQVLFFLKACQKISNMLYSGF